MLDLERKRRELEDAAKKANVKDEQNRKDVQSLIQVLSDYKETVIKFLQLNCLERGL